MNEKNWKSEKEINAGQSGPGIADSSVNWSLWQRLSPS